ncbi:hypothetical protein WJX75_002644 [Coccomyxa subellipsoidea]|uniref:ABC transmembrane type-1 domain-containing protein n=1 Tax=Coccomyxa subellipsoidea TaxID=248742 RepID=A0ABR2YXR5_9CHLO
MNLSVQLSDSSRESSNSGSQYLSVKSDGQSSLSTPTPVVASTPLSQRMIQQESRQESIAQRLAEDFAKDLKELQEISGSSSGIYHMPPFSGDSLVMIQNPEDVEDRITSLGPALPMEQKALLWLGIALDVSSKVSLCVSLARFAHRQRWLWFGATLGFFTTSSAVCVMYWMTHYPTAALEGDLRESRSKMQRSDLYEARVHGLRKETFKKWVRQLGTLCAVCQLGTAFAAIRALFSSEARQRLVEMDLRSYQLELASFFMYRLAELSARVTLLALFANIYGFWTLLAVGAHAAAVVLLLRFSPCQGQRRIWDKATASTRAQLGPALQLPLPRFDDVKLLVACMAWPPSVFVSDATDTQGRFWWRSRMCGRRSACDVALKNRLVPFPAFNCLIATEAACLLGLMWGAGVPEWAARYLGVVVLLHILWGFLGMLWLAYVHTCCVERQLDDLCRVAAQQESLHMKTLCALLPRSTARLLPVLREDAEGADEAWPASAAALTAGMAASEGSPEQVAASREGSPVQALLSSIGVQIPAGDYQEGPQSCPVWRPHKR